MRARRAQGYSASSPRGLWRPAAPRERRRIPPDEASARSAVAARESARYIELQMYAPGPELRQRAQISFYTATGAPARRRRSTLPSDVAYGDNQRTVLIAATPDAAGRLHLRRLSDAGAALRPRRRRLLGTSTASPGATSTATADAAASRTPAPRSRRAVADRSITPGCATLLEAADDTNDSAADFALGARPPQQLGRPDRDRVHRWRRRRRRRRRPRAADDDHQGARQEDHQGEGEDQVHSDEAGSTFDVQARQARSTSPCRVYKHLEAGKHKFKVFAVDPPATPTRARPRSSSRASPTEPTRASPRRAPRSRPRTSRRSACA